VARTSNLPNCDSYLAMFDYQTFSNGFERAKNWESEIGKNFGN